jgi:hypothetical protein
MSDDLINEVERALSPVREHYETHELARIAVETVRKHLRHQLEDGEHTDRMKTLVWLFSVGECFGYCTKPGGGTACWLVEADKILKRP